MSRKPRGELGELVATGARPYDVTAGLLEELRRGTATVFLLEDVHWVANPRST